MAVPLPTALFTVLRTGEPDTHGVPGHATYRGGAEALRPDQRRQQQGAWSIVLDMAAWPVTEVDALLDDAGNRYDVLAAVRRPGVDSMGHVLVDADQRTADSDDEPAAQTDEEGNVLTLPRGA